MSSCEGTWNRMLMTGCARLRVDPDQHCATYSVGLFVAGLRGRGLGREITGLVLSWAFSVLGAHRVELEVLASNSRAINCYLACGFRQEGIRREAGLYPEGWKDFILMGVLQSECLSQPKTARAAESGTARSPNSYRPGHAQKARGQLWW